MKKRLVIFSMAIAAIMSCVGEQTQDKVEGGMSFTAAAEAFEFAEGDQIAVKDAVSPFTASYVDGQLYFVGDVPQSVDYHAVYPYSALRYYSPSDPVVAVMSLPVLQQAVRNEIPHAYRVSAGYASDMDRHFVFREQTAYLKFTIGPESGNIRSISVVSHQSPLSGDFSVRCDGVDDSYPMPGSAYNVCLGAQGDCLEQGAYYIAFRYVPSLTLTIAYEDTRGRVALQEKSVSSYLSGQIIDMGYVEGLTFQSRDVLPVSATLIYQQPEAGVLDLRLLNSTEVEVNVSEGADWLSVLKTRAVSSSQLRIIFDENRGATRAGTFEVVGADGDRRLVYTLVQYGLSGSTDESTFRRSLADFYESTGGDNWKIRNNWLSDLPLGEWYGLNANAYGEVVNLAFYDNGLVGELPETFEGMGPMQGFALDRCDLSGNIPSYIYDIRSVRITSCSFDSISDAADPDSRIISYLILYDNGIEGQLPENVPHMPNLLQLRLDGNRFSGSIPASYGKILQRGGTLYLNGNRLSGEIPESIRDDDRFRKHQWTRILFQEEDGFDFDGVEIYADFDSYDFNNMLVDISDYYAAHEYTLYVDLAHDMELLPLLSDLYKAYGECGLGIVSHLNADRYEDVIKEYAPEWQLVSERFPPLDSDLCHMLVLDSEGRVVLNPVTTDKDDIIAFLEGKYGPFDPGKEPELPVEKPEDGVITVLQTAEEGNGIDLVLMGDSYGSQLILDGTYDDAMREAMEYFFEIEPYRSYRHLFNVYMVRVVSDGDSALGVSYTGGTTIKGNDARCFWYAEKAVAADRLKNVLVITVINSEQYGGTTYMYDPENGDWGNGKAVSYVPKVPMKMDFRGLIQHEAGGHAFAKLADEYVSSSQNTVSDADMAGINRNSDYGWNRNIDFTDDPSEVKWAHILSDEHYAGEPEGVYEGAANYTYGIWRPSYRSIMLDNQGAFNAPSREAIWYRIHKLAYGPDWEYFFDDFVRYDAINRLPEEY